MGHPWELSSAGRKGITNSVLIILEGIVYRILIIPVKRFVNCFNAENDTICIIFLVEKYSYVLSICFMQRMTPLHFCFHVAIEVCAK